MGSRDIYKSGDCYIGEFKDGCSHEHGWFAYIAIIHNSLAASFVLFSGSTFEESVFCSYWLLSAILPYLVVLGVLFRI